MSYISNRDPALEIAKGDVPGTTSVLKFGRNEAVGTTQEDVIDNGGTLSYLTSAETMNVASDDAADTSAGTGARTVQIYGVDGNYAKVNEVVTLNGTSDVETVNSYLRVYRMKVLTGGSGGKNAGMLTATASTSATVQAAITEEYNQTLMAAYTVSAAETSYLHRYYFSVNKKNAAVVDIELYVRPFGGVFQLKHVLSASNTGTSAHQHIFWVPLKITAKSDIILRATASTTGCDVSGGFDLIEVED